MKLEVIRDTKNLDLCTSRRDLRRDLHFFVAYMREREVKRSHRGNLLPKADARRLAKLLSDADAEQEILQDGYSPWLDAVDDLALRLGFVSYDTQGEYAGYTSQEPCFPENFMEVQDQVYNSFLKKTLAQQETQLLDVLIKRGSGSGSEFFCRTLGSRLDRFSSWGSATRVIPLIDFPEARKFLLQLLADLPTGEWLSTASFIALVKEKRRYFLIPKKLEFKSSWEKGSTRYCNFLEGDEHEQRDNKVNESDPDAFERVEGRYIERFLEGIPHLLGYVDVGYAQNMPATRPTLGGLPAFRVSDRLKRALSGTLTEPTVTVTPSFEVYVQSETYPARVNLQLGRIAELVTRDTTTVYRLTRQKVAETQANDHHLDVSELLAELSATPVPDNVRRELADWSQHSEKFVLYRGFSLLETEPTVDIPETFQVECIETGKYIVRQPDKLFEFLERQERVPVKVKHGDNQFAALPEGACSALRGKRKGKPASPPASRPQVMLMRVKRVQLLCPDRDFLQRLQQVLLGAGCPVEADGKNLSLIYSDRYESEVGKAIRGLRGDFQVTIEDKG